KTILIRNVIAQQKLVKENVYLREKLKKSYRFENIIGKNHKMIEIFEMIKIIAPTKATVLILGATGTGKELVARAIHNQSDRADKPFVAVSCAALTETLLESELFGYEKGAFTDAKSSKKGKIEISAGGTLFLDEIGDISPKLQLDLLRVLQEREVTRIGGSHPIRLDVRFIAATNRDLKALVAEGKFRDDLFYRLNVVVINIPSLRERADDIPILAEHFVKKYAMETGKEISEIDPEVMKVFTEYEWRGNVRELESVCERAVILAKGDRITAGDVPVSISPPGHTAGREYRGIQSLEEIERRHILDVLCQCGWNIMRSCKVLGINRVTLYNKIRKFDLKREQN
ncbi:MAG: sigma-54-dependent Fis family transcriptional regulator, partial [Deltaproteobacteria bacterium]|nr:sigma-54-dependent Fis family transcriptional regulator [Deltaproteobacteria bacterium]